MISHLYCHIIIFQQKSQLMKDTLQDAVLELYWINLITGPQYATRQICMI